MLDLGLSVLFSPVSIFVVFKLLILIRLKTPICHHNLNYVVFASSVGLLLLRKKNIVLLEIPTKPWFLGTMVLGILFIPRINAMPLPPKKDGVSVCNPVVPLRKSLVIPVILWFAGYDEKLGALKFLRYSLGPCRRLIRFL